MVLRITPILLCIVLGVWSAGCGGTREADAPGDTSNNGATNNSTHNANDGSPGAAVADAVVTYAMP